MACLTKKDMEELREFCSLGCDYSGTREIITEIAEEVLKENAFTITDLDYYDISDCDRDPLMLLDKFVDEFYTKITEVILNVVETQGK